MSRPRSLYIHVPFCARRCSYCDFAVEAMREPPVDDWIEAIARELELVAIEQAWSSPLELETLYIGGGTPSLLGPGAMERLRDTIAPWADLCPGAEWTCEANPESFTAELAYDWKNAGVNRISLGVQTFHEETLRWMGRLHGPDGPGRAIAAARSANIDNISVDLIFGLPGRLGRDWSEDLERVIAFGVEHVSLYGLTAEAGAPLGRWVDQGREVLADEDRYSDEYLLAHERLTAAGFEHYEVSNFGLPGRRSRHNSVYWTGAPYAALGPGAHEYFPPRRRWNLRSWRAYREAVAAGRLPVEDDELVDAGALDLERIWLALRTDSGYDLKGAGEERRLLAELWARNELGVLDGDRLRLTAPGWLLLDRLALELHQVSGDGDDPRAAGTIDVGGTKVQISANIKLSNA